MSKPNRKNKKEELLKTIHQDTEKVIDGFFGKYDFLSNFYPCKVIVDDMEYKSVEEAFQASKTIYPELREIIKNSKTPGEAKTLGRKVILRENWDKIKFSIMEELLEQKFAPGTELNKKLKDTGKAVLEESNFWNDKIWGKCNGVGENNLGKLLMKIRDKS